MTPWRTDKDCPIRGKKYSKCSLIWPSYFATTTAIIKSIYAKLDLGPSVTTRRGWLINRLRSLTELLFVRLRIFLQKQTVGGALWGPWGPSFLERELRQRVELFPWRKWHMAFSNHGSQNQRVVMEVLFESWLNEFARSNSRFCHSCISIRWVSFYRPHECFRHWFTTPPKHNTAPARNGRASRSAGIVEQRRSTLKTDRLCHAQARSPQTDEQRPATLEDVLMLLFHMI